MSETPVVMTVSRTYDAPAERVFDAWLDSRSAGKWLYATPTGHMVQVDIDPCVGGRFTLVDRRDGTDVEHVGEYLEIERPSRLVFTLCVPKYSQNVDRIAIRIEPTSHGSALTLTHEAGPDAAPMQRLIEEGWAGVLGGLAEALGVG